MLTCSCAQLLANARNSKSKQSLFTSIDNTVTSVGSHLLRSNLASPSTSESTINARLDMVDAFLSDETMFYDVLELLGRLPDLEKTLAGLATKPLPQSQSAVSVKHTNKGIASLICLKTTLSFVPMIRVAIECMVPNRDKNSSVSAEAADGEGQVGDEREEEDDDDDDDYMDKDKDKDKDKADEEAKNELAKAIIERLSDPALKEVQNAVEDSFTESTSYMKNAHAMRHQEVRLRPQPLDNLANNTYTSL